MKKWEGVGRVLEKIRGFFLPSTSAMQKTVWKSVEGK